MNTIERLFLPLLLTILIIAAIWLAVGVGNSLGSGITEWNLP